MSYCTHFKMGICVAHISKTMLNIFGLSCSECTTICTTINLEKYIPRGEITYRIQLWVNNLPKALPKHCARKTRMLNSGGPVSHKSISSVGGTLSSVCVYLSGQIRALISPSLL